MIRIQDIERIARAEYHLEMTALPPAQQNIISDFFDDISIPLFQLFPLDLNTLAKYTTHDDINAYQQEQLADLLEKIENYKDKDQLSPQLWKACLGILSIYINSQDFPGKARYRLKPIFWDIKINSAVPALQALNQSLNEKCRHSTMGWSLPKFSIITETIIALVIQARVARAEEKEQKITVHFAHPEYGSRLLYPCSGETHFLYEELSDYRSTLNLPTDLTSEALPLLINEKQFIKKISDYYDHLVQSNLTTGIAEYYSTEFKALLTKHYPLILYQFIYEQGGANSLYPNFSQYRQAVFNGCHQWPSHYDAMNVYSRLKSNFKEGSQEYIQQKQISMIKEQYFYWFGNNTFSAEHFEKIISFNKTDSTLKVSVDILEKIFEHNVKYQRQSIPELVKKLNLDQQKIEELYGSKIDRLNYYAKQTLQRVDRTELGKLAGDCFALTSGQVIFTKKLNAPFRQVPYDNMRHWIILSEDNVYSQPIWDKTPPWLLILDGMMPGKIADQQLLEGLVRSLCFLITSHKFPNTAPQPLLYWNPQQEQQWKTARLQVVTHLKKLEKIVSAVISNQPLKRNQQQIWHQLIHNISVIYNRGLQGPESSAKLLIRPLETFNISLAEMNRILKNNNTYVRGRIAGEVYRPIWIETNPCENQSLVWSTLHQPRKFTLSEMTISAFNWAYYRIIPAESLSDLHFLSSYCQALMALGGQEELIELFAPQIQRYIKEVIVPLGEEIYLEMRGNQSFSVKKPEIILSEMPTHWRNFIGASIIGLLLFYVLSPNVRIKQKETKFSKINSMERKENSRPSKNRNYPKQTDTEHEKKDHDTSTSEIASTTTSKIQSRKAKRISSTETIVEKRAAIVQLIENHYPNSILNENNSIFIKTTIGLSDLQNLLNNLEEVDEILHANNKKNLLVLFSNGIQISVGYCDPKKLPKNKKILKKSTQNEIKENDCKENSLSPSMKIPPLPASYLNKMIRSVEIELKKETGLNYDFSDPKNLYTIYLTKFIELSHMIRIIFPQITSRAVGGMIRNIIFGKPIIDLDMVLQVFIGFKTQELFESLQQKTLITGYRKSPRTDIELFIVNYRNSLIDMRISHLPPEGDSLKGYSCDHFYLEIFFDTLSAKLYAPGKGKQFLQTIKAGKTPVIEAEIDVFDASRLTNEMLSSCIMQIAKPFFPQSQPKQIQTIISQLVQNPKDALESKHNDLSVFILTLVSHIRDPELILGLLIRQRTLDLNCELSPNLKSIIESIHDLFHVAILTGLCREKLFGYFSKYILKVLVRFNQLQPNDLEVFRAVMLAGLQHNQFQQQYLEQLFSCHSFQFEMINNYISSNLTNFQESKSPTMLIETFLRTITSVHQSNLNFQETLKYNMHLMNYTPKEAKQDLEYQHRLLAPPIPQKSKEKTNYSRSNYINSPGNIH